MSNVKNALKSSTCALNNIGSSHCDNQQQWRPHQVIVTSPSREAAHRHTQETGQQDCVGEEGKKQYMRREPPNACQFQEQNQKADQEQFKACVESGPMSCVHR